MGFWDSDEEIIAKEKAKKWDKKSIYSIQSYWWEYAANWNSSWWHSTKRW